MIYFFDKLGTPELFLLDKGCVSKEHYAWLGEWLKQTGGGWLTNGEQLGLCPVESRQLFLLLLSSET